MDAYLEAQRLYGEATMSAAQGQDRIAQLEQALQRIGQLVPQAAADQRAALLLMNSSLAEQIAGLAEGSR
jgi:hypothetical protein